MFEEQVSVIWAKWPVAGAVEDEIRVVKRAGPGTCNPFHWLILFRGFEKNRDMTLSCFTECKPKGDEKLLQ